MLAVSIVECVLVEPLVRGFGWLKVKDDVVAVKGGWGMDGIAFGCRVPKIESTSGAIP